MAKKIKGSLIYQVKIRFKDLRAYGKSKPKTSDKIYSYGTSKAYLNHCLKFATYCRKKYNCKTIGECKPHIKEWIEGNDCSPSVKKVQRSAIAKMYGVTSKKLGKINTGTRSRATVKRSRGKAIRDKHFNEQGKYKAYVDFCRGTGLRKSEVESLRGNAFKEINGKKYLEVVDNTKGGRYRKVPILEEYEKLVQNACLKAGDGLVIPIIAQDRLEAPNGADTHSYRADYAKALYNRLKRPLEKIPSKEKYYCRNELKGTIYDKKAMKIVSNALGHSRLSIISQSYLY